VVIAILLFLTFIEILFYGDCLCGFVRQMCHSICSGVCALLCCQYFDDEDDMVYGGTERQKAKTIEDSKDVNFFGFDKPRSIGGRLSMTKC
jgi:hypothetical protein